MQGVFYSHLLEQAEEDGGAIPTKPHQEFLHGLGAVAAEVWPPHDGPADSGKSPMEYQESDSISRSSDGLIKNSW